MFAQDYSSEWDPASAGRKKAVHNVREWLDRHPAMLPSESGVNWAMSDGGTNGNTGYVPWVRVFDRARWHHVAQGLNVVWFFSGAGDAVHLSLCAATSQYGGTGRTRPRSDHDAIYAEAQLFRARLELPGRLQLDGVDEIDLGLSDELADALNPGAIRRVANYEAAHVCGFRYQRGQMPGDETLLSDQTALLRILLDLSETLHDRLGPTGGSAPTGSSSAEELEAVRRVSYPSSWRTRVPDAKHNQAVELQAMNVVDDHYRERGWTCIDVSATEPYDIKLVKGEEQVHVEVKGATGPGEAITLTANEVRHAQTYPDCVLAVVANITVEHIQGVPVASGGTLKLRGPWIIEEDRLTPTQYRYDLT